MSQNLSRNWSRRFAIAVLCAAASHPALAKQLSNEDEPARPAWEFSRAPVSFVNAHWELLEIRPTETIEHGSLTSLSLRDGSSFSGEVSLSENEGFKCSGTMRVREDGFAFETKIEDARGRLVTQRTILVPNYKSAILEVMEDPATGTRLAVRLTASAETIPPFEPYPDPVTHLAVDKAILIMNDDTVIAVRPSLSAVMSSPCLVAYAPDRGAYLVSPRPFPGAEIVGGVDDESLRFRLGGDRFEMWTAKPMLREGRWLLWGKKLPAREFSKFLRRGGSFHESPSRSALGIVSCE
jgi:hypothetical protein